MKIEHKIMSGLAIASIATSAVSIVKTIRDGRKDRKEIEVNMNRELEAIHLAAARVEERIEAKRYNSINEIMTDFEFQIIVENDKMR